MIPDGWKISELGELVTFQRGHDLPRDQMLEGIYPVAGSNGIIGYHDKFTTYGPGITIGRSGNIGIAYYYESDFWAHNTTLYIKEFKECYPRYIYYLLKSLNFTGHNSGSAVPSLNRNFIHPIQVIVPSKVIEQSRIASILASLDDKIELNLQMNKTLEAIAQAIFKEWFVDFRFPGFEGELVDGLPKGWRIGEIQDICSTVRNPFNPKQSVDNLLYVGLEHIPRKSISLTDWGNSLEIDSHKSRFNQGDILFGKLRPYFHKVVFAPIQGVCSTDIFVIRPKKAQYQVYALFHLASDSCIRYANSYSDGTRMPRVAWSSLSKFSIYIPSEELLMQFQYIIKPVIERIESNCFENRTLIKLRDNILPKLMTGKIRVSK